MDIPADSELRSFWGRSPDAWWHPESHFTSLAPSARSVIHARIHMLPVLGIDQRPASTEAVLLL